MTKEELLALIASKIDGQGDAVDAGGALGEILRGILEIAESGENPTPVAPLKIEDNELSLELGPGLTNDGDDKLTLDVGDGLSLDDNGLHISQLALDIPAEAMTDATASEVVSELGISIDDLNSLLNGDILFIDSSYDVFYVRLPLTLCTRGVRAVFGAINGAAGGMIFQIEKSGDLYNLSLEEA